MNAKSFYGSCSTSTRIRVNENEGEVEEQTLLEDLQNNEESEDWQ